MTFETDLYRIKASMYLILQGSGTMNTISVRSLPAKVFRVAGAESEQTHPRIYGEIHMYSTVHICRCVRHAIAVLPLVNGVTRPP
jgi:hypothetical protein